jgi:hypothetical protein
MPTGFSWETAMRVLKISTLLLACSVGSLALAPARAEPEKRSPAARIERLCSDQGHIGKIAERQAKRDERLIEELKLTDAQKAAFKDLQDVRAKNRASMRTAICANKPDLSTFAGKLSFREAQMQRRLDNLRADTPKLLAFYNSLDAGQKTKFEETLRHRAREGVKKMRHEGTQGGKSDDEDDKDN